MQVIQHLNARETDTSLGSVAGEYESEIQQMLQQTVQQVNSFAEQIELRKEEARMKIMVQVSPTAATLWSSLFLPVVAAACKVHCMCRSMRLP